VDQADSVGSTQTGNASNAGDGDRASTPRSEAGKKHGRAPAPPTGELADRASPTSHELGSFRRKANIEPSFEFVLTGLPRAALANSRPLIWCRMQRFAEPEAAIARHDTLTIDRQKPGTRRRRAELCTALSDRRVNAQTRINEILR
jgi:hypothetical protein